MLEKVKATLKLIVAHALGASELTKAELRIKRDVATFESVKKSLQQTKEKILRGRAEIELVIEDYQNQISDLRGQKNLLGGKYSEVSDKLRKLEELT